MTRLARHIDLMGDEEENTGDDLSRHGEGERGEQGDVLSLCVHGVTFDDGRHHGHVGHEEGDVHVSLDPPPGSHEDITACTTPGSGSSLRKSIYYMSINIQYVGVKWPISSIKGTRE